LNLEKDEVEVLRKLGLTYLQAKVYITLALAGSSTARSTSKSAQVARQDIYRILDELETIGLIEKGITAPTTFKAIPIEEGITILIERRIEETTKIKAISRELILSLNRKAKTMIPQKNQQFILIPKKEVLIRRLRKTIEDAQCSIEIIASGTIMPQILFSLYESFNQAMERGVKN